MNRKLFALGAAACLSLTACDDNTAPVGYTEVSSDFIHHLPAEPLTAFIGYGNSRKPVQVDSPAGCLDAGKNASITSSNMHSNTFSSDDNVTCFARDGKIVAFGDKGRFFVPTNLAPR